MSWADAPTPIWGNSCGWYGGVANAGDERKKTYYDITKVEVKGDQIQIDYAWQHGRLRLVPVAPFYASRVLRGVSLQGTWTQGNGFGCVELEADEDKWQDAWSERVGADWAQESLLRAAAP
jgi:hypothetical protein